MQILLKFLNLVFDMQTSKDIITRNEYKNVKHGEKNALSRIPFVSFPPQGLLLEFFLLRLIPNVLPVHSEHGTISSSVLRLPK